MARFFYQGCTQDELPFPDNPFALIDPIFLFLAHSFEGKFSWQKTSSRWVMGTESMGPCSESGSRELGTGVVRVRVAQVALITLGVLVNWKEN